MKEGIMTTTTTKLWKRNAVVAVVLLFICVGDV